MKRVELLAPAGNYEAFLGAIHAGADAVYLGGEKYSARAYADNFSDEEIISAIRYAHIFSKKVYLTINTLMKQDEYEALCAYVLPFYENGLDGVIIQDMGAFFALKQAFPSLELHASTQMTLTSELGVRYLKELGASRVVPARELSLDEIKTIKDKIDIELECFVHGAMCYCYSGQCFFSSLLGGRSGNRGRCAQPCRLPYKFSEKGQESYPFSLKDMCTIEFVPMLIEAGIDSFKIEGRMKKPEYAAGVTAIYRKYIDMYYEKGGAGFKVSSEDMDNLRKLYIRSDIQDGYYFRHNGKEMITPGKPSYLGSDESYLSQIRKKYIEQGGKLPIEIFGSFLNGEKSVLTAVYQDITVAVEGNVVEKAQNRPMSKEDVEKQLQKLGNTCFSCEALYAEVGEDIFIPNKMLNELRRTLLKRLEEAIIEKNGFVICRKDMEISIDADTKNRVGNIMSSPEFAISITTKEQLLVLENSDYCFERLYLDYELLLELEREKIDALSKRWILGVIYPRIVRKNALKILDEIYRKSSGITISVIKNLETLQFLKNKNYTGEIIADYTIYVCNSGSAQWAQTEVKGMCYPIELNKGELTQIRMPEVIRKEQVVYAYLPLMVTANCLKKTTDQCGQKSAVKVIYDRYKKAFFSKSRCRLCYSELYNCVPISLHKYLKDIRYPVDAYRVDFTIEDSVKMRAVLDLYFKNGSDNVLGEYTTGHFKRGVE